MSWLFWNKSDTKCEQRQTVIWPQKWCSQEYLGNCVGKCGLHTALSRSCSTGVMHMVTPHVPQMVGLVYSLPHMLVHLHDCKQSNFRRDDWGHKFGALGAGRSNWARSIAMQAHQTGGKEEGPLQCLPRTMPGLSPAPSARSKDDVLQRKTKDSCNGLGEVKDLPLKHTRIVFWLRFSRQQF